MIIDIPTTVEHSGFFSEQASISIPKNVTSEKPITFVAYACSVVEVAETVLGTFMMCSTQLGSNQAFSESFHQCLSHTTLFSRVNPAFPSDYSDNTFHLLQPLLVPPIFQWRVVASALSTSNSLQMPESTSSSKDSLLLLSSSYVSGTCSSSLILILLFPLCPDFFRATLLVQHVRRPFRKFWVCIRRFLLRFVLMRNLRCHHRRHPPNVQHVLLLLPDATVCSSNCSLSFHRCRRLHSSCCIQSMSSSTSNCELPKVTFPTSSSLHCFSLLFLLLLRRTRLCSSCLLTTAHPSFAYFITTL